MIFAYVRVSTVDQNPDSQIEELEKHGFDQLFVDKISGSKADRPELKKLLEKKTRPEKRRSSAINKSVH